MTPPLFIAVPPSTAFLSPIRAMVTSWLGLGHLTADRWCLVVTELVTNAMSVTDASSSVTVELRINGSDVELTVTDSGPGVTLQQIVLPDPSAPRGRGLLIVDALTTGLTSARQENRTIISCRRAAADDQLGSPFAAEPITLPDSGGGTQGSGVVGGVVGLPDTNGSGGVGPTDHTTADSVVGQQR